MLNFQQTGPLLTRGAPTRAQRTVSLLSASYQTRTRRNLIQSALPHQEQLQSGDDFGTPPVTTAFSHHTPPHLSASSLPSVTRDKVGQALPPDLLGGTTAPIVTAFSSPGMPHVSTAAGAAALASEEAAPAITPAALRPPPGGNILQRIKDFFVGSSNDRAKLANLGMGAFAAYSVISNANYGFAIAAAWLSFVKINHVSPLAPGQWKPFLAYYAGLWAIQNFARPLRLAGALALAPFFNRVLETLTARTGLPKGIAFTGMLMTIALLTTATLGGSLYFLGGFPPITQTV